MAKIEPPPDTKNLPLAVIKNMISLATSGFGVVVALAWNELIKTAVKEYIDPFFGKGSGIISLFIYATFVTFLAVIITLQLGQLQKKIEEINGQKNSTD